MKSFLAIIKRKDLSTTICLASVIAMVFLSLAGCEKSSFDKGKEAYDKKQWLNAIELFSQIENSNSKYQEARKLLSSANMEIFSERFSKASELSEANDNWQLIDSLLKDFSKDHPRYGDARALIEDLHGWNVLNWGMTEQEVLRALGDKGIRLKEKEEYGKDKRIPTIGINEIQVGAFKYKVRCFFDSTGRLTKVVILPKQPGSFGPSKIYFKNVEKNLVEKYGPSTYKNEEEHTLASTWTMKHTTISLYYNDCDDLIAFADNIQDKYKIAKLRFFSLTYSKLEKSKNDNL